MDGECRAVDAAKLLGARMHVHERLFRGGNVEQAVALRGHFAEPAADQHDQVGRFYVFEEFWIGPDAEVAGIVGMELVEQHCAAETGRDRHRKTFGEAFEGGTRGLRPAAAAGDHDRALGAGNQRGEPPHLGFARRGFDRLEGGRVRHRHAIDQHVLGQRDHHRSGPAAGRGIEGARDYFGNARGIVDFGRPFGESAEHCAIVDLLKRLTPAHVARDLADEQDHRRRILLRNVNAGRRVGRARPTGDEADAGRAGDLADGLRHHRGAALLAADRHRDRAIVQGIKRRDIALARHAEHMAHAVDDELIDQHLPAGPRSVIGAHGILRSVYAVDISGLRLIASAPSDVVKPAAMI